MRIAITAPHLNRDGGVPRITCLLANALVAEGHDVAVITRFHSTFHQQPVASAVERRQMYVPRGPKPLRNAQLPFVVASLRRHVAEFEPDVVIGCRWDCAILSLLAARCPEVPTVAWEQGHLPDARLSAPWRLLRRVTYARAAAIVVINRSSVALAGRLADPARVHVIPNYMSTPEDSGHAAGVSKWNDFVGGRPAHRVLAVGRLSREKGFDLLVDAFAAVVRDFPNWGLLIIGRGPEHEHLQALIASHGLEGRAQLGGPVAEPIATFLDSDLFVLPSRSEGYGVALVEAMSAGLPSVAFDCAGPRDIITHDVDGLLVSEANIGALSDALRRVMADPELRVRLGQRATAVDERLSRANVMRMWNTVLRSVGDQTAIPA